MTQLGKALKRVKRGGARAWNRNRMNETHRKGKRGSKKVVRRAARRADVLTVAEQARIAPLLALPEGCPYCGKPKSDEELALQKKHGALQCPDCGRDGCFECMPAGRGCMCPECEEAR